VELVGPLNVRRYNRVVELTEVVITEFKCLFTFVTHVQCICMIGVECLDIEFVIVCRHTGM
jgi:hypothetical protein